MRFRQSFTFIELIMVMAIIGILAGSGAWLMANTVKNSVFIPNQLNMDKLVKDALDIMVEGDFKAKGLRFCKSIGVASANSVQFITSDNHTVIFSLDVSTGQLSRSIDGNSASLPYYFDVNKLEWKNPATNYYTKMNGRSITSGILGTLFTYYDSANQVTANAANVRRIGIILIAKTGTGLYNDWQGSSEQATSVAVKNFP